MNNYNEQIAGAEGLVVGQHKPDVICEILPNSHDHQSIEGMLGSLGCRYFLFTDAGPEPGEKITPTTGGRDWMPTTRPDFKPSTISPA